MNYRKVSLHVFKQQSAFTSIPIQTIFVRKKRIGDTKDYKLPKVYDKLILPMFLM